MKIKFFKKLGLVIIGNLLMGCTSQLTYGDAVAQEIPSNPTNLGKQSVSATTNRLGKSPLFNSKAQYFVSLQQEYMYKILVGEIAKLRGNNALAAEYFLEVAVRTRNPSMAERATQVALYAQKYHIAMEAARLWISIVPDKPEAHQVLAVILLNQKRTDKALIHLEAILDTLKGKPKQLRSMMDTMLKQQEQSMARDIMGKLIAKRPKNPMILFMYSRLLINTNQTTEALEVLRTLLTIVPEHAEAVPLYAYLLNKQGQTKQALQWLSQVLYKYPKKQEWRLMYARMLADAEKFDESIIQFKQLLSEYSQHADILYALGVLSLQTEQLSNAKKYFQDLIKSGERVHTARYYLGQIAQEEKDLKRALYWYKQINVGPNYLNAQARIALILVEQNQFDNAIKHLQTVQKENYQEAITLIQLEAELLLEQKKYKQAMEAYNRALKLKPNNTEVLYMRALLYEKMGDVALLERDLRSILVIDPENISVINALGYSLTEYTNRYQEAYELIKKALTLSPTDYYILDSMGWVLYKMGNYTEAVAYLRKAQAKQADPEVAAHLGEVLWVNGDQQEAKDIWEKAVKAFPKDKKLRKVMSRFLLQE